MRRLLLYVALLLAACAPTVLAARALPGGHTGVVPTDVR
jgi:hypothetical protein